MIAAVIYYVGLNMVGIDQLIVSTNIARYEATKKIDIDYLGELSYSAIPPLVELYQENPEIFGLKTMLSKKREQILEQDSSWQSYNLSRKKAKKALKDF
ncbi:DUF4173 domain-containing protein [Anaerobacillus sp. CMMVII]|nr:DUF4173 domain-containing protein [Anaerobacillus sp. CMMVII]